MFIVDLAYKVPLKELDDAMHEHVKFLKEYYKKNVFIASGRKVPRTGGIILALSGSRDELIAIMDQDPFISKGLADYTITEFLTSQYHPQFKGLLEL